jgi:hypothetical protein
VYDLWPQKCLIGRFRGGGQTDGMECFQKKFSFYPPYDSHCGWHLSSFNGPDAVWRKLSTYSHTDLQYFITDPRNHKVENVDNHLDFIQKMWEKGIMFDGSIYTHPFWDTQRV